MSSDEVLLAGLNLAVWRGDSLLFDALDIEVHAGEALQLRGANGSGKTTLLRVLCGMVEPDEGEVRWSGQALHRVREDFHAAMRYLGHKPGLSHALNARENLTLHAALSGRVDSGFATRLQQALGKLDVAHRIDVVTGSLSAGQQRRVALARLLLEPAPLWVLDEPLNALDVDGIAWVRERIVEQVSQGGAVLFSTHQPMQLPGIRHRVIELDADDYADELATMSAVEVLDRRGPSSP